jgi:hypothetical protein
VDRKVHSFSISKFLLSLIVLVLVIVIEFFILKAVEHEHDYDARGDVTLSTLAYISR